MTVTIIVTVPLLSWALTLELLGLRQWSLPFTVIGIIVVITGILFVNLKLPRPKKGPSPYGNARTTGTPLPWMAFTIILGIAVISYTTQHL